MILGRGSAQTDAAIIAEYHRFLETSRDNGSAEVHKSICNAPFGMLECIGKPIRDWSDEDIITIYQSQTKQVVHRYNCFISFLLFRGYYHPSLTLLATLSMNFSRLHRNALLPLRQKIEKTTQELDYNDRETGMIVSLLTWVLTRVSKPLEELTRADFDHFREEYQQWYCTQRADGRPNPRLTRVEYYLIHWGVIPRARCAVSHDEYFSQLRHETIKKAISTFVAWCQVKYKPASVNAYRAALLFFFSWLQEQYPTSKRLDDVTRKEALAYAEHLQRRQAGGLSRIYCNSLYQGVRIFFDFAIMELLDTAPLRNPFSIRDMPRLEDPIPRYLADHEVRTILEYCDREASLRERTMVIILLHTGIRIAELMALQTSDIVQIQGRWKVHIREGKGLKDRLIPLTEKALAVLQVWQEQGWEGKSPYLFTLRGKPLTPNCAASVIRRLGRKLGVAGLTAHRFRHTFAVALINYGMRESALQKLLGHTMIVTTLHYGRILDKTVEQAFDQATVQMQHGGASWIPNFFVPEEYTVFVEGDAIGWIKLGVGFCRRNPKLHCESDVKCLLCDRFRASPSDLPRLR
jgi:site-specific recombinase XerD